MAAPLHDSATPRIGWVERLKAFRDSHGLKPLLCLLIYLLVPLLAFQLIFVQYPGLDPTRFKNATVLIIPIAFLIVVVALVQERHPKGTHSRLLLDGIYVLLSLLWLLSLIGGSAVIHSSYEGHPFTVDITPLVALAIMTAAANFAHDVMEFRYYAEEVRTPTLSAIQRQAVPAAVTWRTPPPVPPLCGSPAAAITPPPPGPAPNLCSVDIGGTLRPEMANMPVGSTDGTTVLISLIFGPDGQCLPPEKPRDTVLTGPRQGSR